MAVHSIARGLWGGGQVGAGTDACFKLFNTSLDILAWQAGQFLTRFYVTSRMALVASCVGLMFWRLPSLCFSTLRRFCLILEAYGPIALQPQREQHFSADQQRQRCSAAELTCNCQDSGGAPKN